MKRVRIVLVLLLIALMAMGLAACGKKAMVSINDRGVLTEIEVKLPNTVEKILQAAEIQLGEEDQVEPALDVKLQDPEEIVIKRKNTINLDLMGEKKSVVVIGGTIADLLKQEGIVLEEKQQVNYKDDVYLTDGMEVKIFKMSSVTVKYDGKEETKDVEARTVGDAIKELGISLGADDKVDPAQDKEITDGMTITVQRVKTETVTEKEVVEYEVTYEYDGSKSKGVEETLTAGQNGEKEVTYKVTYIDGKEDKREVVEEKVTKEPVNAVVSIGTYEAPAASSSSSSSSSTGGRTVVSRKDYPDCDGSGHGYYEIIYSDGTTEYVEY
ncbi:MAG: G5 domain-containing protein [Firmicutes bacterium]|nr:G5 domain-containing protein [Bacillota bacterium]